MEEPSPLSAGENLSMHVCWQSWVLLYSSIFFLFWCFYKQYFVKKIHIPVIHLWYIRMESAFVILTLNSVTLLHWLFSSRSCCCSCSWLWSFLLDNRIIYEQRQFYFFLPSVYTFCFLLFSDCSSWDFFYDTQNGERRHPCLDSSFRVRVSSFSPFSVMLDTGFLYILLINWRKFPFLVCKELLLWLGFGLC